jgi:hypothetical protein
VGELTTLAKNSKRFASLRTAVPMSIVKQWKLREGHRLEWSWEVVNDEMVFESEEDSNGKSKEMTPTITS